MTDTQREEKTPAQLMESFRGSSLKSIIVFTVVVHLVLLVGTSSNYLYKMVAGEDTTKLSEDERLKIAVSEATTSLRQIAEAHGLKPQDLSRQFADGKPKAAGSFKEPAMADVTPADMPPTEPEKPKSAIEQEIEKVEPGPALPAVGDEEVDLFK